MSAAEQLKTKTHFTQAEAKRFLRLAGCSVDLPAPDTRVLGMNGWTRGLLDARVNAAKRMGRGVSQSHAT